MIVKPIEYNTEELTEILPECVPDKQYVRANYKNLIYYSHQSDKFNHAKVIVNILRNNVALITKLPIDILGEADDYCADMKYNLGFLQVTAVQQYASTSLYCTAYYYRFEATDTIVLIIYHATKTYVSPYPIGHLL